MLKYFLLGFGLLIGGQRVDEGASGAVCEVLIDVHTGDIPVHDGHVDVENYGLEVSRLFARYELCGLQPILGRLDLKVL